MKINEIIKGMDTKLFIQQKEWIAKQIAVLAPSGSEAVQLPEGLLNLLDQIQDAAEEELGMCFEEYELPVDSKNLYEEEVCAGGALESEMNYTLKDNGAASVSSHNGDYDRTWEVKEILTYQPKVFNLTVCCQAYYNTSIELPIDFTGSREDAIMYAKEHLDELPRGILEYVPGSDELDEENCDFE